MLIAKAIKTFTVHSMFFGYYTFHEGQVYVVEACTNIPNGDDSWYVHPRGKSDSEDGVVGAAFCLLKSNFEVVEVDDDSEGIQNLLEWWEYGM